MVLKSRKVVKTNRPPTAGSKTTAPVVLFTIALSFLFTGCPWFSDSNNDSPSIITITYDANGADDGAVPVDDTAYERRSTIEVADRGTLSLTDYFFAEWNEAADGSGTGYAPGDTLTAGTEDMTLYAIWSSIPLYAVNYDGNGADSGDPPVDSCDYQSGDTVTVLGPGALALTASSFVQWNTASDGSGTAYSPDDTFTIESEPVTLYAQWEENLLLAWGETPRSGSDRSTFGSVAVAPGGNVIVGGSAGGAVNLGNSVTAAAGSAGNNALLVSYDADGNAEWAFQEPDGATNSRIGGVAADSSGNIYAIASIQGTSTWNFGNGVEVTGLMVSNHSAVVKFNASGVAQWAFIPSAPPDSYNFYDIAESDGTVYIAGIQRGNSEFDYGSGVTAQAAVDGRNHALVLTLDAADGTALDAAVNIASSVLSSAFEAVGVDADGNVYAAGNVSGSGTYSFAGDPSDVDVSGSSGGYAEPVKPNRI